MDDIPQYADIDKPFLGLLSTRGQAEVAVFLLANGPDSFSIAEISRATDLAPSTVREALSALRGWGQAKIVNPAQKRPRFAANEASTVTYALRILTAAAVDSLWPSDQEFPRAIEDTAQLIGVENRSQATGAYEALVPPRSPGAGKTHRSKTAPMPGFVASATNAAPMEG